jgi:hypothetical protein
MRIPKDILGSKGEREEVLRTCEQFEDYPEAGGGTQVIYGAESE